MLLISTSKSSDAESETSTSNDESIASDFGVPCTKGGLLLLLSFSVVLSPEDDIRDSCISSNLFATKSLLFLTASISGPVGTKVRALYFVPPSPESLLWL